MKTAQMQMVYKKTNKKWCVNVSQIKWNVKTHQLLDSPLTATPITETQQIRYSYGPWTMTWHSIMHSKSFENSPFPPTPNCKIQGTG
jgi:hypothetical protein